MDVTSQDFTKLNIAHRPKDVSKKWVLTTAKISSSIIVHNILTVLKTEKSKSIIKCENNTYKYQRVFILDNFVSPSQYYTMPEGYWLFQRKPKHKDIIYIGWHADLTSGSLTTGLIPSPSIFCLQFEAASQCLCSEQRWRRKCFVFRKCFDAFVRFGTQAGFSQVCSELVRHSDHKTRQKITEISSNHCGGSPQDVYPINCTAVEGVV